MGHALDSGPQRALVFLGLLKGSPDQTTPWGMCPLPPITLPGPWVHPHASPQPLGILPLALGLPCVTAPPGGPGPALQEHSLCWVKFFENTSMAWGLPDDPWVQGSTPEAHQKPHVSLTVGSYTLQWPVKGPFCFRQGVRHGADENLICPNSLRSVAGRTSTAATAPAMRGNMQFLALRD